MGPAWVALFVWLFAARGRAAPLPRRVRINGRRFVLSATNESIVLGGPNVVVKGPPYLPSVSGDEICNDHVDTECVATGTCKSCSTFNAADVAHIKSLGWNTIRVGVVWAGAQPRDEPALDPDFLDRLHSLLDLTDETGIHVVLDNHGDMVGSAGCGNGVPMWFQKKAAPELIGKPLETGLPYKLIPMLNMQETHGYSHCGANESKWAAHAGDPNYNLLNECCLAMNGPNPGALGFNTVNQKTMDYLLSPGQGRDDFVRFWTLVAQAVEEHPSAFAAELLNEPMSIHRKWMFETWKATADAINAVVPDMSVSICDVGEGAVLPAWVTKLTGGAEDIPGDIMDWIKGSQNVFYAWHYGDIPSAIHNMQAISAAWNVPVFGTETGCSQFKAAAAAGISHSYWHYSCYCNTGPAFGNRSVPDASFGACILGWSLGNSSACIGPSPGQGHLEHHSQMLLV